MSFFSKKSINKLNFDYRRLGVYILTNFNTTLDEDLDRVYKTRDLGYSPYLMVYDKGHASAELKRMQRWVNSHIIFRSCTKFEDYKAR